MNRFLKLKNFGTKGEKFVQCYLEEEHNMQFIDRPNNITGYDLQSIDGIKWEVKTDRHILQTMNFPLEVYSNKSKGKLGWLYTYDADFLAFVVHDKENKVPAHVIFLDFRALKEYYYMKFIADDYFDDELTPNSKDPERYMHLASISELEQFRLRKYDFHRK